jgi:hypothetical protein
MFIFCPHRLLVAYDAIQHVRQYHMLARQAFSSWLCHQQRRRRKKQQWQRAATHRELLRMQGKPLLFWLHWMRVERYARVWLLPCCHTATTWWIDRKLIRWLMNV